MLGKHLHLTLSMILAIGIANVIGGIIVLIGAKPMALLARERVSFVVPIVLVTCAVGAYAVSEFMIDLWIALAFTILGYVMKRLNYSRETFILGMVLGLMVERNFHISYQLWGIGFLLRPMSLTMILLVAIAMIWPNISRRLSRNK